MHKKLNSKLSEETPNSILKQVINSMTNSVFFKGLDGKYLGCNLEYEKVIGRNEADIIGKTAYDLNDVELAERFSDSDQMVISTGMPIKIEVWINKADGTRALFENNKSPLWDDDCNIIGIVGVLNEITKQKEVEEALQASEEKYRMIAENTTDIIWVYNLDLDRFTYYSPSIQQLRGISVEETFAEKILDTVMPEFREIVSKRITDAKNYLIDHPDSVRREILEVKQPTQTGEAIWVEVSARLRYNAQNEIEILGVSRNIEDRKKTESEILYLGYHDQLTGLYNRHYFETIITEAIERSDRYNEALSMLMLDLDYFKMVNDTWGHQVGDEILTLVAKVIGSNVRISDTIFRFGGEEFIILLPQTIEDDAIKAAEKIRVAIEREKHPVAGFHTASIGVAQRMRKEPFRHWYRRVDEALYQAKENGRNLVVSSYENKSHLRDTVRLIWQPEWESGNSKIDKQHKELIEMANSLINMTFAGKGYQELEQQVELLLNHIVHHFEFEEGILNAIGYPCYRTHVNIHKELVTKALQLKESCRNGEILISALFSFMVEDVILGHLMVNDKDFFPYTREKS